MAAAGYRTGATGAALTERMRGGMVAGDRNRRAGGGEEIGIIGIDLDFRRQLS